MVKNISFDAVFGDSVVRAELKYTDKAVIGYQFTCGNISGTFMPTVVWGWRYYGTPLELDDIQLILNIIFAANQLDEDGLDYDEHIIIHNSLRRFILTREDKLKANNEAVDFYSIKDRNRLL